MSTPATIAIDDLLAPIPGDNPSGRDLRYDPAYGEIEEARRSEDDAPQGDVWQRKTKISEWDRVLKLGTECLARKSKDLQIAAWMTEALTHRHRFAGLRDGLRLLHGLQEAFWETYYPQIDEGDLETRHRPFTFLNTERILPFLIRSIPITQGFRDQNYSLARYNESRITTNVGLKSSDDKDVLLAEGKIDAEMFDDAVSQTSKSFYVDLHADFEEAVTAFREFEAATDARFGEFSPSLTNIRKAMDECGRIISQILEQKREAEPDEVDPEITDSEREDENQETSEPDEPRRTAPARSRSVRRPSSSTIETAEEAREQIARAAEFLRRADPGDPSAYLVVRAMRMAPLYSLPTPFDPSRLDCPASDTRQNLRRLVAEENWVSVLEESEAAITRSEGLAWLDPQRAALLAMSRISDGVDYLAAAKACHSFLRAILSDFPDLPRTSLADDTNAASDATRLWLNEVFALPQPEPEPEPPPEEPAFLPSVTAEPASNGQAHEPDAWEVALVEVRSGRVGDALQRIRREVARASNGREKFVRKLQLAELCLMARNIRIASPLLEELARLIDVFRLEEWEDEDLCARVWSGLYQCLRAQGGENVPAARLQEVYTRLCRLDIEQAMALGEDGG